MSFYKQAFGLSGEPFHVTPDPALLFLTPQHREALAGLAYAIAERKGFAMLTGPAGTGKTTLVRKVLHGTHASAVDSSVILNPTLSTAEFLEAVLLDFGIREIPASKAQRIWTFQRFLLESHRRGRVAALIVDEAHKLSADLLEEVRLLSNFEFADRKLLQIVLVGQCELLALVDRPGLGQFKQRIVLRLALGPLEKGQVGEYMHYRWAKAGGGQALPFTDEAIEVTARLSGGIPRVINTIADNALLLAFGQGTKAASDVHVFSAARDLGLGPLPEGTRAAPIARAAGNGNGHLPAGVSTEFRGGGAAPQTNGTMYPLRTLEIYRDRPRWWRRWAAKGGRTSGKGL